MTDDTTTTPKPVDPPTTDTFVDRISSRHFIQAFFVQITGAAALFLKIIDGGTYVALSSLALSIYGAASITDKKLNGPDYDPTRHDR